MTAMVPPLTPGKRLATPIAAPDKKSLKH